ncbi:MAG: hypothetical protein ACYTAN_10380 [Planctomycetota bacterium]|jgi:hypothetical protein
MPTEAASPKRYRVLNLKVETAGRIYALKRLGETWDACVERLLDERDAARKAVARRKKGR